MNPYTHKPYSAPALLMREAALKLPVSREMPEILRCIESNPVTILVGETGSGKSTQTPQYILKSLEHILKGKMVCVTQPRRLAVRAVGERIMKEMDLEPNSIVGTRYRGHDTTDATTRILVCTDGTLLAMAKSDPTLPKYGVIIIDEAHQHTVATDLLLGLLKSLLQTRKDLRVVIMSATVNADKFQKYFEGSVVKTVPGRPFKITTRFLPEPSTNVFDDIARTIAYIHLTQKSGNILVFVSGVLEIQRVSIALDKMLRGGERFAASEIGNLEWYPLHSKLSEEEQQRVIHTPAPPAKFGKFGRKIIIATNIAETSITMDGVNHVIDSCRAKYKFYNARDESYSLREGPISKAEVRQRAGRAGRTSDGYSWPMCTQRGYEEDLPDFPVPPIMHSDMTSECLHILKLGYSPISFPYINAPAPGSIVKAFALLYMLGAIDLRGRLTDRGRILTRIPTDDVFSALALYKSYDWGCSDEVITVLSMIEATEGGSHLFIPPNGSEEEQAKFERAKDRFRHVSGDHLTLFNIYTAWRDARYHKNEREFLFQNMLFGNVLNAADGIRTHLMLVMKGTPNWGHKYMQQLDSPYYYNCILQALCSGGHLQVAMRPNKDDPKFFIHARTGLPLLLSRHSELAPPDAHNEFVFYHECYYDPKERRTIRVVSGLTPELLITAETERWWNPQFAPVGPVKERLLEILSSMNMLPKDAMRGYMPKPSGST